MKKKNLKTLKINKKTISNFNTVFGGKGQADSRWNSACPGPGCGDTAQSFCANAPTCDTGCEVTTATEQTNCCN